MQKNDNIESIINDLKFYGYGKLFELKEDKIFIPSKNLLFSPSDLFFVDAGYKDLKSNQFVFAINSPLYDSKGYLVLSEQEFIELIARGYSSGFNLDIIEFSDQPPAVEINRQYNMRKITRKEYNPSQYELREGFPDFPPCPYGHTFKVLGYDKKEKEYVRFIPSILKNEKVNVVKFAN